VDLFQNAEPEKITGGGRPDGQFLGKFVFHGQVFICHEMTHPEVSRSADPAAPQNPGDSQAAVTARNPHKRGKTQMDLPDLSSPRASDDIARFDGDGRASPPSKIDYNLPLPGAYPINRIVPLELDVQLFKGESATMGDSLVDMGVIQQDGRTIDSDRLALFYRRALPVDARPSKLAVARVGGEVLPLLADLGREPGPAPSLIMRGGEPDLLERRRVAAEPDDVEIQRRRTTSYIDRLKDEQVAAVQAFKGTLMLPMPGLGNSIQEVPVNPIAPAVPRLALVETWELRSFLGDYGLGRTLNTFSLFPGERTTITIETWRTDAATREDATSIFDSSDTAAQTRFSNNLAVETGSAFQDQGGWSLSVRAAASASASFGIVSGSASLETGFAANHQQASQSWTNNVAQTASEHANQVNNSRRQAVQSSSTSTTSSGSSTTTVREIANTNLRRVLNFVYRELNQKYETYVVIRDIKVAFYNGRIGSAEIVPISELRRLIQRHVKPDRQEEVARLVLGLCVERLDQQANPVTVLEVGSRPDGVHYRVESSEAVCRWYSKFQWQPSLARRWRFAPGFLNKEKDKERKINGLITSKTEVVLRTDSVVVEALLGEADALDPYASAVQALDLQSRNADTDRRQADTRRITDALNLVQGAKSNDDKIAAWTKVFPEVPDIQVVPVAAVTNDDNA
jgi:hypothetical protein